MINTIFYFVKDLETYRNKLLEEGISSRTIVFVTKERLIMKGGMPFGGMDETQLKEFIYRTLDGDWLNASIYPYITEQIALIDLSAVWSRIDEVGSLLSSASAQITLLSSNVESFITAQATRNDEFTNAIGLLQTRVTTVDGKVDAVTSSLTSTIENVATGLINSAGFVTMATLDESLAGVFATNSSSKESPEDCSLQLWSDLPVATTDEYPYLWLKIEQKNVQQEIVSTSYMRITGEDHTYDSLGMCVDAQYANNNSPAAANIHDEYEVGDIYIRIKSTSEAFDGDIDQEHPWVAMTFEGPTDTTYSFNTSKNPATGFAQILVQVSNDNSSKITLSADQIEIEGQTIIDYLTSEYLNATYILQQFENKKVVIAEGKINIESAKELQGNILVRNLPGGGHAFSLSHDSNGVVGTWKDNIVMDGQYIYNEGLQLSQLGPSGPLTSFTQEEIAMAGLSYFGPKWRLGFDGEDPIDVGKIRNAENLVDLDVDGYHDPKYTLAITSGLADNIRFGGGIYCEGELYIKDALNDNGGIRISADNSTIEGAGSISADDIVAGVVYTNEITAGAPTSGVHRINISFPTMPSSGQNLLVVDGGKLLVDSKNNGDSSVTGLHVYGSVEVEDGELYTEDLTVTGDVKVGSNSGITLTISIPAGSGLHYSMVIEKGIITGCTLEND